MVLSSHTVAANAALIQDGWAETNVDDLTIHIVQCNLFTIVYCRRAHTADEQE